MTEIGQEPMIELHTDSSSSLGQCSRSSDCKTYDIWAEQSSNNNMSSNMDVGKSTQTTEQQTLRICSRNVSRHTDRVTRHGSTFESQLIDDQEQKLGVKDSGLFFDGFRVGDAWISTDHDGSRGECRRPELDILMVPWSILSSRVVYFGRG